MLNLGPEFTEICISLSYVYHMYIVKTIGTYWSHEHKCNLNTQFELTLLLLAKFHFVVSFGKKSISKSPSLNKYQQKKLILFQNTTSIGILFQGVNSVIYLNIKFPFSGYLGLLEAQWNYLTYAKEYKLKFEWLTGQQGKGEAIFF